MSTKVNNEILQAILVKNWISHWILEVLIKDLLVHLELNHSQVKYNYSYILILCIKK